MNRYIEAIKSKRKKTILADRLIPVSRHGVENGVRRRWRENDERWRVRDQLTNVYEPQTTKVQGQVLGTF